MQSGSIGNWSAGVQKDAADAWAILVNGDSEVTVLTPVGTPGVSNDKVLLVVFTSVADCSDGVVLVLTAFFVIHDAFGIEREGLAISIDADAGWLLGHSFLQGFNLLRFDFEVFLDTDFTHI